MSGGRLQQQQQQQYLNSTRNNYAPTTPILPEVNTYDRDVAHQTARKTIKVFNRINYLLCG